MIGLGLAEDYHWQRDSARERDEARAITYQQGLNAGFVAPPNTAGPTVTPFTAFEVSAWWNGISVIAGDIGVLDFNLYRRDGDNDRVKVTSGHPVAKVLDTPNEYMTPYTFWQTMMGHVLAWGNGYAEIEYDNALRPIGLWPIKPNEIEPVVEIVIEPRTGARVTRVWYRYLGQFRLEAEDVLHIPGLGFDGLKGYSVVQLARQSLSLTMAIQRFGGSFFGNGAWTGMVLEHPGRLTKDAVERIRSSVAEMHQGSERAFKTFVAEEGMKVGRPVTVNPNDAQANETFERQIEEVARWLNLPPHKLKQNMGERPGGNLEAAEQGYHTGTLLPWTTLIDQITNRKLISQAQRGTYYVEHNYNRRLQPLAKDRAVIQQMYQKMGVLTAEQIAQQENLPKPTAPPPPPDPAPAPEPKAEPTDTTAGQRVLLTTIVQRYLRRESKDAVRAAKKGPEAFGRWVESFYGEDEARVLVEWIEPAVALCLLSNGGPSEVAAGIVADFVERYQERSRSEMLAVRAKDVEGGVPTLVRRWETARAVETVEDLMAAFGAAKEKEHVA